MSCAGATVKVSCGDVQPHGRFMGADDVGGVTGNTELHEFYERVKGDLRSRARVVEKTLCPVASGRVDEPGSAAAG